jgi:hypothetical protein
MFDENDAEERVKFRTNQKVLMVCGPCTFDHEEGESASYFYLLNNKSGDNESCSISLADSRTFALRLLVSLWTAGDELAGEVLDKHFEVDGSGRFVWPKG